MREGVKGGLTINEMTVCEPSLAQHMPNLRNPTNINMLASVSSALITAGFWGVCLPFVKSQWSFVGDQLPQAIERILELARFILHQSHFHRVKRCAGDGAYEASYHAGTEMECESFLHECVRFEGCFDLVVGGDLGACQNGGTNDGRAYAAVE